MELRKNEVQEDPLDLERKQRYWKSLLSMKPTGNAMVDAGFHEEMRSALRDALHALQDLTHRYTTRLEETDDLVRKMSAILHDGPSSPAHPVDSATQSSGQ